MYWKTPEADEWAFFASGTKLLSARAISTASFGSTPYSFALETILSSMDKGGSSSMLITVSGMPVGLNAVSPACATCGVATAAKVMSDVIKFNMLFG